MDLNEPTLTLVIIIAIFFTLVVFLRSLRIVPQKKAYIVERFGKYKSTLGAGFHVIMPILDRVAYKHDLKERAIDVPPQKCITKDNVAVEVDGILYLQVFDPQKASYGIVNYLFATTLLAQTTMRSVIGKLELDKTFEERENINTAIVDAVDKASDPWGLKVTRYEIKNIEPPQSIKDAMEKQMRAVREKRALIAQSEGERQSMINRAEGEKQKRINEAEGKAAEIEKVATATADGISKVAEAINNKGGLNAVNLRVAEHYLNEFGKLAQTNNTIIIPSNLSDIAGMITGAMTVIKEQNNSTLEQKIAGGE